MRTVLIFIVIFLSITSLSLAGSEEEIKTFQKYALGQKMTAFDAYKITKKPNVKIQGLFSQTTIFYWGALKATLPNQFAYVSGNSVDKSDTIFKSINVNLKVGANSTNAKIKPVIPNKIQINYYYYGYTFDPFKLSVTKNVDIKLTATCEKIDNCALVAEKRYTAFTPFVNQYVEVIITYPNAVISFYSDYYKG